MSVLVALVYKILLLSNFNEIKILYMLLYLRLNKLTEHNA